MGSCNPFPLRSPTPAVFRTPSKTCPLRHQNGKVVLVLHASPWKQKCRRLGNRAVNHYAIEFAGGYRAWALPDELFFDPQETLR